MPSIELEIDNGVQYATAYLDGQPIATVQRARVLDKSPIRWTGYDLEGNVIFASMNENLSAEGMVRRINRILKLEVKQ